MSLEPAAIGIDIGGTGTKGAIVGHGGEIVLRAERPTDPTAGTKTILSVAEELLDAGKDDAQIVAIGVGAAGFIDFDKGSVVFSPNLVYDDPHIEQAVATRFGLTCAVDNDANAAVWGERTFGSARGLDDVVMLTLGTGIGSGIIVNGDMMRGSSGAGAEMGHMVVNPDGPECGCGLKGCLEQFASGRAIQRAATEAVERDPSSSILDIAESPGSITGRDVAKAAREMDETARSILRKAGTWLGVGLSNIANIFDPDVIVLTGSVVDAGEPYLGPARDTLVRMTQAQRRRPMRLDVSTLKHDAGVLGSAALALQKHAHIAS
ncbi:MAG: glucokinase [Actinomycetota bacterium]|jgi:glucokinase|nr:glucokinase [Actinomycetota bacterium]